MCAGSDACGLILANDTGRVVFAFVLLAHQRLCRRLMNAYHDLGPLQLPLEYASPYLPSGRTCRSKDKSDTRHRQPRAGR